MVNAPVGTPGYPLGADESGRDIWTRLLHSINTAAISALIGAGVALMVGVIAGLVGGYFGAVTRASTEWLFSLIMTFPGILLLIILMPVTGGDYRFTMLIFGVLLSPGIYRIVRNLVRRRQERAVRRCRAGLGPGQPAHPEPPCALRRPRSDHHRRRVHGRFGYRRAVRPRLPRRRLAADPELRLDDLLRLPQPLHRSDAVPVAQPAARRHHRVPGAPRQLAARRARGLQADTGQGGRGPARGVRRRRASRRQSGALLEITDLAHRLPRPERTGARGGPRGVPVGSRAARSSAWSASPGRARRRPPSPRSACSQRRR